MDQHHGPQGRRRRRAKLKEQIDGIVQTPGSLRLVQTLRARSGRGLHLMVFPVILGTGRRLFGATTGGTDWRLTEAGRIRRRAGPDLRAGEVGESLSRGKRWLVAPLGPCRGCKTPAMPARSACGTGARRASTDPRGPARRSWARPQALRRRRDENASLLRGERGLADGGLRRRGGPPPRLRAHADRARGGSDSRSALAEHVRRARVEPSPAPHRSGLSGDYRISESRRAHSHRMG